MSTFYVAVQVSNRNGDRSDFIEALVDTGASHSIFPASFLRSLGIEPYEQAYLRFADERRREFSIGKAQLTLFDKTYDTPVVFGDDSMSAILGAVTLEEFRLAVDPVGRRLIEVDLFITEHPTRPA